MLLQVNGLKTHFGPRDAPVCAVDGVSFEIDAGETLCLVGESGSGKSITSLSIMQLTENARHPAGSITFAYSDERAVDILALAESAKPRLRGKRIAMIFQEPMTSLNPVYTVGSQILEPLRQHTDLNKKDARARVIEMLGDVKIPDPEGCFGKYPHELSGGMRQRVMIAMAMICEPDLLIADEPTTALDVTTQAEILALMKALQARSKTAILFITHDFGIVRQMADRVAVMKDGLIIETGPRDEVLDTPQHPYTQELIASLPAKLDRPPRPAKPSPDIEPLVKIQDLKIHFPIRKGLFRRTVGHVKAVDGVDLSIMPGSITALVGESGSGKTTLGKSLVQLLPITSGSIHVSGEPVGGLKGAALRQRRREVQIIFQDPYASLNPRMMIGEVIEEGMVALGVGDTHKIRQGRIADVLKEVHLDPKVIHRYPHEFSGGQRQRIGIARCLAVDPGFIVCDEITSALDVSIQASILRLLLELRDSRGLTMLFITHNMDVVSYLADQVAVMHQGRIVETGPVEQVCHAPVHAYTQTLLAAVPRF